MTLNLNYQPFLRNSVGFDHFLDLFIKKMNESQKDAYPPCNIQKMDDDSYLISLSVAGFSPEALEINLQNQQLIVSANKLENDDEKHYIHKGIAARPFQRIFNLADFVEVLSAELNNGILEISLKKNIPEEMKPRTIKIKSSKSSLKLNEG